MNRPLRLLPLASVPPENQSRAINLDTGADATMIPVNILAPAGARYVEQQRMRGLVGDAVTVNLYLTAVHIGEHIIHGIRAIGVAPGSEAIIGRDVLNQLEVALNGPALETWIS